MTDNERVSYEELERIAIALLEVIFPPGYSGISMEFIDRYPKIWEWFKGLHANIKVRWG